METVRLLTPFVKPFVTAKSQPTSQAREVFSVEGQLVLDCEAGTLEPAADTTAEAAACAAVLAASFRQYAQPISTTSPSMPKSTGRDNVRNMAACPRLESGLPDRSDPVGPVMPRA